MGKISVSWGEDLLTFNHREKKSGKKKGQTALRPKQNVSISPRFTMTLIKHSVRSGRICSPSPLKAQGRSLSPLSALDVGHHITNKESVALVYGKPQVQREQRHPVGCCVSLVLLKLPRRPPSVAFFGLPHESDQVQ